MKYEVFPSIRGVKLTLGIVVNETWYTLFITCAVDYITTL